MQSPRPAAPQLASLPPLSLYLHFPWCLRKCPYCDFNSHAHPDGPAAIPEAAYLDALRADLDAALPQVWGRPVVSVFIGGGTPSLLSAEGVDRLLSDIRARLPLVAGCEITLEANPGSFEAQRFADYRGAGVTRLSIGVQSFDDAQLARLGRVHDRAQALAAIETAQRHFETFNLDLMYALPQQSQAAAQADVETALALAPPHLSLYQLTIEPNTVFAKRPPVLPDEDTSAAIHEWIEQRMAAAGFRHYEVSAYARPGHACRHNLNYWHFGDYLGLGAGAHGKLSFPQRILREQRYRQPDAYLTQARQGRFVSDSAPVAVADLPFEFMLNALRLTEGVAAALFSERCGLPATWLEPALGRARARGLVDEDPLRIRPTALGRRFLSDLQAVFLR